MNKTSVTAEKSGVRIDQYLTELNPEYSRSYFSNLIKNGYVTVGDKPTEKSYIVKTGDIITYELVEKEVAPDLAAEKIDFEIIYEDNDVIVINKPASLVVHPAAGNQSGTLVNGLLGHFPKLESAVYDPENPVSVARPGLVHRLDKDTTGVMIVAKNTKAMIFLARQFKDRKTRKIYQALCFGWTKSSAGTLMNYLGRDPKNRKKYTAVTNEKGREAILNYQVVKQYLSNNKERISLVQFELRTGRTHQIRVQSKIAGFPIIGDQTYGTRESEKLSEKLGAKRQLLHAKELHINLPGDQKISIFKAPFPGDFSRILDSLDPA